MDSLLLIFVWILSAVICGMLARTRRRNIGAWVILGLLFSWLSVIVIALLPPRKARTLDQLVELSELQTLTPADARSLRRFLASHHGFHSGHHD